MSTSEERWDAGRDTAQQILTALVNGDRSTAGDLAAEWEDTYPPIILSMVLADLCAYVHIRWATAVGMSSVESWTELMTDVEGWRATAGDA